MRAWVVACWTVHSKFCVSASLSLVQSPGTHKKKRKKTLQTYTLVSHIHTVVTQISPEGLPNTVDKNPISYESKCFLDLWDMLARQTMWFKFKSRTELLLYNWGQKNQWKQLDVAAAGTARIHIESVPSSICVWAGLSFTSLITHGAGRLEDLASGALQWHMLTWISLLLAVEEKKKKKK